MQMTDAELRKLLAEATPGKWEVYHDPDDTDCPPGFHYSIHAHTYGCVGYWTGHKQNHKDERWYLTEPDARLIAAARTLAAEVLALRAERDTLQNTVQEWLAQANARAEAAEAALSEAREALRPFIEAAEECDEWGYDDDNQAPVTAGDCRAARAAADGGKG